LYKDNSSPLRRQIDINQTKSTGQNDDPQIPQPDLRFARGNSEATGKTTTKTKKGAGTQTKTPTKSICHGTQWHCPLHHYQKRANELKITAFGLH